jgi:competence protein ComEC
MRIYDIAFYIAGFFIFGVLLASLKLSFLIILAAAALMAVLFLFIGYFKKSMKSFWLAGLCLVIIPGAFYYFWRDVYQVKNLNIAFDEKINFQGLVIKNPERGNQQKLTVALQPPSSGNILIKLQPYPGFDYGDLINFEGVIKRPKPVSYADYLAKEGIFGTIAFPKTELIAKNQGSAIKSFLFKFKEKIVINFQKTLPPEKSAFLAGITLGERAEFSKEFKEAMSKSGTTHLVALSGYNITIIVLAMFALFNYFLSRRLTFILTILVIFGFVLMAGAEASVVRAAIMGFIALLASQVSRLYGVRNAIILAAFFMVLINPKVLYFDTGFQLSFAALIGIIYLSPAIKKFFKISDEPGLLSLRENFLTTLSAQLFVLPFLVLNFGKFSLIALLANLLILSAIPLTMTLGFIIGFLGFFSYYLSLILGWFANLFLSYEVFVIKFLGQWNILQISSLSIFLSFIYYSALVIFVLFINRFSRRGS